MGHVLHAVIGPKRPVEDLVGRWHPARLIQLPQEFALVPLTASLHDDIVELANVRRSDPFGEFERLSAGVELVLREGSRAGPLAYIETDYFGGVGTQNAVAWSAGKLLAGPFRTATTWNGSSFLMQPAGEAAVNRVLAALGVWTRDGVDRFDMLELGRLRDTESVARKRA